MNTFQRLKRLLPDAPLFVGTITSIDNGVATIEVPGGAQMQARGEGSNGDTVFFRDGAIEGPAPSLPIVEIEV